MKEIATISGNVCFLPSDNGKVIPMDEVILIYSEPVYGADLSGVTKERGVGSFRFSGTAKALRQLAKGLEELADEAEQDLAAFIETIRTTPAAIATTTGTAPLPEKKD